MKCEASSILQSIVEDACIWDGKIVSKNGGKEVRKWWGNGKWVYQWRCGNESVPMTEKEGRADQGIKLGMQSESNLDGQWSLSQLIQQNSKGILLYHYLTILEY